ncbi:MAG: 4-(cytidine 5'-diphospho)-2-C-methyl-D-erythritol kinase [Oscillospiraceae bacterium]|nr:4-(cytidine 5'-diphospho)-2-C-methyl-D-erythritol kinase [Oscillospiraceae bacterium]
MTFDIRAGAKLNLTLDIVSKREDGYHNIASEMQEIDLADDVSVTLTPRAGIRIECDNPKIPTGIKNVAFRAAKLFLEETGLYVGVKIVIRKRIPLMGGLGGSSTNGAAVLKALNHMQEEFQGKCYDDDTLRGFAARLGADAAFSLVGGRAKCEGIGDIITPLPDLPPQFYTIIQPNFCLDTREGYALYDRNPNIERKSANVFQDVYNDPRINAICDRLTAHGAKSAVMTGSGSAVFGVFESADAAQSATELFPKDDFPFRCVAQSVPAVPAVKV